MKKSRVGMSEDSEPIKTISQLDSFCNELLKHGKYARRNFTAFILGVKCFLRASDVLKLGFNEIYTKDGGIRDTVKTRDKKTNKYNLLWLGNSKDDLRKYYRWYMNMGFHKWYINHPEWYKKAYKYYYHRWLKYRKNWTLHKHPRGRHPKPFIRPPKSGWLFPKRQDRAFPMSRNALYIALKRSANNLGMSHVSTHTARKTGAYFAYKQNHNDIALVQHLLNHANQATTLRYLGIKPKSEINKLKHLKF